jgi:predicted O-methyltransferase YrrM
MSTLISSPASTHLAALFADAAQNDRPLREKFKTLAPEEWDTLQKDHRLLYGTLAREAYLAVTPEFGRLLYLLASARKARRVVEFGTSFGVSTIHLAAALRDNGGGKLVTTEYEVSKAERARKNLEAAGLLDLVEIRVGDALETLRSGIDGPIDLVLLDGPKDLYLPVLRLLESMLAPGAVIAADNTKTIQGPMAEYLAYVREPQNGYLSVDLPIDHGNELSIKII